MIRAAAALLLASCCVPPLSACGLLDLTRPGDATPLRDPVEGRRIRGTVAGGCPASVDEVVGVDNPRSGLDAALLPAAAPSSGLVCRYGGLNDQPPGALQQHRALDAAAAARVADAVRAQPLTHADGVRNCPMMDGSVDLVVLAFPGRDDVDLWVQRSGCRSVANGHIRAELRDPTTLDAALAG